MVSNFSRRASNRIYMPIWQLKILLLQCNVFTMQHCLCSDCFRLYKSYLLYMYPFACTGAYPTMNKYIEFFSHYQIWSPRVGSTPYTPIFSQNAKLGPGIILAPTAREKRTRRKINKIKKQYLRCLSQTISAAAYPVYSVKSYALSKPNIRKTPAKHKQNVNIFEVPFYLVLL